MYQIVQGLRIPSFKEYLKHTKKGKIMENLEAFPVSSYVDEVYRPGSQKLTTKAGQMALKLTPNAQLVLRKRYLVKDDSGQPTESEEDLFRRVALAIAQPDVRYEGPDKVQETARKFYDLHDFSGFYAQFSDPHERRTAAGAALRLLRASGRRLHRQHF